jgi:hypothetical protein
MKHRMLDLWNRKGAAKTAEWLLVAGVVVGTGGFVFFRLLLPELNSLVAMTGMEIVALAGN